MKKQPEKQKNLPQDASAPSLIAADGQPEDVIGMVNFYGTYNIQPTAASDNKFPAIGHGISAQEKEKLKKEAEEWLKKDNK